MCFLLFITNLINYQILLLTDGLFILFILFILTNKKKLIKFSIIFIY